MDTCLFIVQIAPKLSVLWLKKRKKKERKKSRFREKKKRGIKWHCCCLRNNSLEFIKVLMQKIQRKEKRTRRCVEVCVCVRRRGGGGASAVIHPSSLMRSESYRIRQWQQPNLRITLLLSSPFCLHLPWCVSVSNVCNPRGSSSHTHACKHKEEIHDNEHICAACVTHDRHENN